jgi:hypothetical protein
MNKKPCIHAIAAVILAVAGGNIVARAATAPTTRPVNPFRSNVKVEVTDDLLIVHSDGIPDHETGPFPNPHNPNSIRKQNYTFKIPRHPVWSDHVTRTPMGPIGVAINGVPFYNPYTAEGRDAAKSEVFDECCGHPDQLGRYHYHIYPKCVHTSFTDEPGKHSPLIGFAFDGYPIYGPNGDDGKPPKDLDECNGHSDPVRGYHYHVTNKFPYIIGGYHGVVEQADFDHGPRLAPLGAGGPGQGPGRGQGQQGQGPGQGPQAGFHLLPPFAMQRLNLTDDQRKKITDLETEVRAKLKAILTADQFRQLEQLRPPPPRGGMGQGGGRQGGRGPGGGPPDNGGGQGDGPPPPPPDRGPGSGPDAPP